MANKRVASKEDPLVQTIVYLPRSQKNYLDKLEGSTSRVVRELISFHMQRPLAKMQLIQENKELKIKLALNEASIKQHEEIEKLEASRKTNFEGRKADGLRVLVRLFRENRGDFSKFKAPLNHWADALQVPPAELQELVIEAAKVKEVK